MAPPPRLDIEIEGLMNYLHLRHPVEDLIQAIGPPGLYEAPNGKLLWNHSNGVVAACVFVDVSRQDYVFDWIGIQHPPTKARMNYEGLALENSQARLRMGNPALVGVGEHRLQWCSMTPTQMREMGSFRHIDVLDMLKSTFRNDQLPLQADTNAFNWAALLPGNYSSYN
jgi:hypothetical protein